MLERATVQRWLDKAEWNNTFLLRFDADGRCSEFREWYMQRKL